MNVKGYKLLNQGIPLNSSMVHHYYNSHWILLCNYATISVIIPKIQVVYIQQEIILKTGADSHSHCDTKIVSGILSNA